MDFDPNQPQPLPCYKCGERFNFSNPNSKERNFAIALHRKSFGLYCKKCGNITLQKLKGGWFSQPRFEVFESLNIEKFKAKHGNSNLGQQLISEISFILLENSVFFGKATQNLTYFHWRSYIEYFRNYEKLLEQMTNIDGLHQYERNGKYEENCFGDNTTKETSNFWACLIKFSNFEWNVNLQFHKKLKPEFKENEKNIKENLKFKERKYWEGSNSDVDTYYNPNGRYVNIFKSNLEGEKRYNIIIEY